ncbi:MAG: hypothetical protein PUF13_08320 [Lachnospiraceae bacterium]|nr:hypothetical protein [Lachnospiraceae bacterium]
MDQYTKLLEEKAEMLSPEEEGYEAGLIETASMFRGFHEALTDFMVNKGYTGDLTGTKDKVRFLKEKFKAAGFSSSSVPRNMELWFDDCVRKVKRDTAFKICFAFGLNIEETNDFFRRVYLERGFDCHTVSEAVYYFCIRNGLSYPETREILAQIPEITESEKTTIPSACEPLYTSSIMHCLDQICTKEDLVEYITGNREQFFYNNVKAAEYIRKLWSDITEKESLAISEGELIEKELNPYHAEIRYSREIPAEIKRAEEMRLEDYVVADEKTIPPGWSIHRYSDWTERRKRPMPDTVL